MKSGLKKVRRLLLLTCLLLCQATTLAWSQLHSNTLYSNTEKVKVEHLTLEQGVSLYDVSSILQDSKGYMWFSSSNGLKKYDGYTFTTYKHDPEDSSTISENLPNLVWEDKEGNIWLGTSAGGLSRFDPFKNQFIHFRNSLSNHAGRVTAINEDSKGTIWIGHWGGKLTRFNKKTNSFFPDDFSQMLATPADTNLGIARYISFIYNDTEGKLWIGNNKIGVHHLDNLSEKAGKLSPANFTHFRRHPNSQSNFSSYLLRGFYQDHAGIIWLCTANGLNALNPSTGKVSYYFHKPDDPNSINSNDVTKVVEDHQGNLWIATINGLNKLNKNRTQFTAYYHDPLNPSSISSDDIQSLYVDRSGIVWVGTAAGVDKIYPNVKPFSFYQHNPFDANSLSDNSVRCLWEDKSGVVWIGTLEGGLNTYDRRTGKFTHYRNDPKNPKSLPNNLISSILEDRDGNLWIATAKRLRGTLSVLNRETGEFIHYAGDSALYPALGNYAIRYMYEDRLGHLWLCTSNGIISFDRKTGVVTHYPPDTANPDAISDEWTFAIREDSRGNFWVGTDGNALEKLDRKTGKFIHYKPVKNNPGSISSGMVRSIYEDSRGVLWIGTVGGGLCRFNHDTETFTIFNEKQGLPGHSVYSIQEDHDGNLWLGTNNGLSKFNSLTQTFTNYDISDGLQSNYFAVGGIENGGSFKGRDSILYFGGLKGVTAFDPRSIGKNNQVPPVVITQFKLLDRLLPGKNEQAEIQLAYQENIFSFEFASLNYIHTAKNQYAFKLEGVDKDWVYSGTLREARYTNISPGKYIFRVRGSNNDRVWNKQGASIAIIIHPPWWHTPWAYVLYALLIIGTTYGLYSYLLSKERLKHDLAMKKLEAEKLQEMDEIKSRFFTNISHEFRTPLTLILGPVQHMLTHVVEEEQLRKNHQLIYSNAHRLLELINQLLDISKLEAGSMSLELQQADIVVRLQTIVHSFASLAESKGISLSIEAAQQHILTYLDKDKFEKIINNLLSNAFKYTSVGGAVTVKVAVVCNQETQQRIGKVKEPQNGATTEMVEITIADTGTGIAKDQVDKVFDRFYQVDTSITREKGGSGIGLALVKELVELHKGEIKVESEEGKGSVFSIRFPLAKYPGTEIQRLENQTEELCLENHSKTLACATTNILTGTPADRLPDSAFKENESLPLLLIIEDNVDVATYIKDSFIQDYLIIEARNGQEGLEAAMERIPDLIISDWMMPKMDGLTLCNKLKTNEQTSHIPIILLTAKANVESKLEGLQTGADDYLIKPFYTEELLVRAKNLIDVRKKLRERYSRELILQPSAVAVTSTDERFLEKVIAIIEANIANVDFSVEMFGKELGMSRMQLHRKLNALLGQSPNEFIRSFRLKRAVMLLEQNYGNISQIAFSVGFNSLTYFTKCFREQYGKTPSEYLTSEVDHSQS